MDIRFLLTEEATNSLTWDDIEAIESKQIGKAKNVVARFLVDADDNPIPFEQAKAQLGKLKIPDILKALEAFMAAVNNGAINPPNAANS